MNSYILSNDSMEIVINRQGEIVWLALTILSTDKLKIVGNHISGNNVFRDKETGKKHMISWKLSSKTITKIRDIKSRGVYNFKTSSQNIAENSCLSNNKHVEFKGHFKGVGLSLKIPKCALTHKKDFTKEYGPIRCGYVSNRNLNNNGVTNVYQGGLVTPK